jgi:hypothetical protein
LIIEIFPEKWKKKIIRNAFIARNERSE